MDDPSTALAGAAASTIVRAMTRPHWPIARDRMAQLLGGNDPEGVRRAAAQLDDWCTALRAGQVPRELIWQQWQGRLKAMMDSDPRRAAALSALVADIAGSRPPAAPEPPAPRQSRRRGRRLGAGAWIGIASVPVVLALVAVAVLVARRDGGPYGVGDCVLLEWRGADSAQEAFVALGAAPCGANMRGDGTYEVSRVVTRPRSPDAAEYCELPANGGTESWFRDDATDTLYCVVD